MRFCSVTKLSFHITLNVFLWLSINHVLVDKGWGRGPMSFAGCFRQIQGRRAPDFFIRDKSRISF